ncbi:MAG: hypothetical protein LBU83_01735 [Bacteroidales bacterium]|jgi:hypothetical protein|nr:hypothetical protein [Bacteroidales bacterium]
MKKKIIIVIFLCCIITILNGQENLLETSSRQDETTAMFLFPFGYDFVRLGEQNIHLPAVGIGYMSGEQNLAFEQVEHRVFALALWRPVIFSEVPHPQVPKLLHNVEALIDWRIHRHQLLFILNSSTDKPIAGGLNTFQIGAGWGYEIVRSQKISLILGAALAVGEYEVLGKTLPVLPVPLLRFGLNTQWLNLSFDFLTGPNLEFTIAPEKRIRFTADMRMDYYRSMVDVICEFILWYRLFSPEHRLGDFAGVGIGFKNDSEGYLLSANTSTKNSAATFEMQKASIFVTLDLSLLRLEGGWIFGSRYLLDEKNIGSSGKGFYVSIQGIIPIGINEGVLR